MDQTEIHEKKIEYLRKIRELIDMGIDTFRSSSNLYDSSVEELEYTYKVLVDIEKKKDHIKKLNHMRLNGLEFNENEKYSMDSKYDDLFSLYLKKSKEYEKLQLLKLGLIGLLGLLQLHQKYENNNTNINTNISTQNKTSDPSPP